MKFCSKCSIEKTLSSFNRRGKGYQSWCRDCSNKNRVENYKNNRSREQVKSKEGRVRYLEWYSALKDGPCADCGNCYPYYVMQWDHLPGEEKEFTVGDMASRKLSKERLLKEIEKCELVCANCHAMRTFNRQSLGDVA